MILLAWTRSVGLNVSDERFISKVSEEVGGAAEGALTGAGRECSTGSRLTNAGGGGREGGQDDERVEGNKAGSSLKRFARKAIDSG